MEFIAEIIANVLLAVGIFGVQWCVRHKEVTKALLVIALMVVDVIVIFRYFR